MWSQYRRAFAAFGHHGVEPELALNHRKVAKVFAVAKSALLLLVIRPCVFIPQDVKSVKHRLGASEEEVSELRLSFGSPLRARR